MKNNIKNIITGLFALTMMAGFAVNANAQTGPESGNINVTADLQQEFVWSNLQNIVFGIVSKGDVATINPETGVSTNASIGQVGHAQLAGGADAAFNVTFPSVVELEPGSGPNRIFLHLDVTQASGALTATSGGATYTSGAPLSFTNPGLYHFFLGGTLSGAVDNTAAIIPTDHDNGTYTGTFTLTATYN